MCPIVPPVPSSVGSQGGKDPKCMKLYVGNLPYQASEADLETFFAEAGVTVDSVSLVRDRFSGQARGFGFVEIHDNDAASRAISACNGKDLMGRALVVNEAQPRPPREGGGGRGGSGGRPQRGGSGRGRPPRW